MRLANRAVWQYPAFDVRGYIWFGKLLLTLRAAFWADNQRRGSMLAWIVILSVYGADTIADLSLSALIS